MLFQVTQFFAFHIVPISSFKWDLFNISFEMTVECPIAPIITGTIVTFVRFHNDLISTERSVYARNLSRRFWARLWSFGISTSIMVASFVLLSTMTMSGLLWGIVWSVWTENSTRSWWIHFLLLLSVGGRTNELCCWWCLDPTGEARVCIYRRYRVVVNTSSVRGRCIQRWHGGLLISPCDIPCIGR